MAKYKAIIGAAYGDEAKGRTVNQLASPSSLVVRFNGGGQAGHTVVARTPNGRYRHVFSQFGAATLKGAATYLSRFFVFNPMSFLNESKALESMLGYRPKVFIHQDCPITTEIDIAINQSLEDSRGESRHGSVGVGFGETLEREASGYGLTIKDVRGKSQEEIIQLLDDTHYFWLDFRLGELGIDLSERFNERLGINSLDQYDVWLRTQSRSILDSLERITVEEDDSIFQRYKDVIFEGAQGLMLDQHYGEFPYVTRSNTGLKNVRELIGSGIPIDVWYITRAYTTRHGAGPFPHELEEAPYTISDETNITNDYQGSLRYSYLNLDTIAAAVQADLANERKENVSVFGVMTCCDQTAGHDIKYITQNQLRTADTVKDLSLRFSEAIGAEKVYRSYRA